MPLRAATATALLLSLPEGALAHPHVFIDAALSLDYAEDGALREVAVEWAYDEFYSLLIIEDLGLDPDGDGVLTEPEMTALQGFDAEWEPGFDGRLYLSVDGAPVALEGPRDFSARYEDGRLVSRHVRPVAQQVGAEAPLRVQVYDPEYYVQFSLPEPPAIQGAECRVDLRMGDPYAAADAYARAVADALEEDQDASVDQELLIVDIGATGADEARIACGPGA